MQLDVKVVDQTIGACELACRRDDQMFGKVIDTIDVESNVPQDAEHSCLRATLGE